MGGYVWVGMWVVFAVLDAARTGSHYAQGDAWWPSAVLTTACVLMAIGYLGRDVIAK